MILNKEFATILIKTSESRMIQSVANTATAFLKISTWDTNHRSNKFWISSSQLWTNRLNPSLKPLKSIIKSLLTITYSPRRTFLTAPKPSSISSKEQSSKNYSLSFARSTCPTNYNLERKKWWWKSKWETIQSWIVFFRLVQISCRI